jgi:hypothetical protein
MLRILTIAGAVSAMTFWHAGNATAQILSAEFSLDGNSYHGRDRETTKGDRSGEVAFKYEFRSGFRLGAGVGIGKFDEPVSDPSFTTVNFFLEPSWGLRRSSRVRPFVGGRVSWEHERVGDQNTGLWAYGWGAGALGGVAVKLGERVSVAGRVMLTRLDLERDASSHDGLRLAAGATFALTWPSR